MSSPAPKPLGVNSNTHVRRLPIERIRLGSNPKRTLRGTCHRVPGPHALPARRLIRCSSTMTVKNYFLKDGFQRVEAALRLGRKTILAEVIPGTRAGMALSGKDSLRRLRSHLRKRAQIELCKCSSKG